MGSDDSLQYIWCKRNPSHREFVSVEELTLDILPHGYRGDDLLSYMKAMSDLTVLSTVKKISGRRSELSLDLPNLGITDKEAARAGTGSVDLAAKEHSRPCQCGERHNLVYGGVRSGGRRVGTGYVNLVTTEHNKPCQCGECASMSSPRMKWGLIYVTTTAHMVYDESEAAETSCHLWFDRGRRPDLCSEAVALSGMKLAYRDLIRDYTVMTYATHDLNLVNRLEEICARADRLSHIISHKYPKDKENEHPLAFIVSHPHGHSKRVSVGFITRRTEVENSANLVKFYYNTATCPGSNGAVVVTLEGKKWCFSYASHSGGNSYFNFSGLGWM